MKCNSTTSCLKLLTFVTANRTRLDTLDHRFTAHTFFLKAKPNMLVQNSSKTTKKFFTFDVSTSIRGLHQKKLVPGLLLPVLGAIS